MTPQEIKKMSENKNDKPAETRGVRTSEFWLALATSALSIAILAGWVNVADGTTSLDKICAMAVMGLGSLGYTVGRSWTKRAPKE